MAQPSATKVVRDLERLFGFPLFERLPRGMHPTDLGAEVLSFAQRVLADLRRFADDLELKKQGGTGQLVFGTVLGAAPDYVARAIAELKQRDSGISIKLVDGTSNHLVALLLAGKLDLAIGHFTSSLDPNVIVYENLRPEVLCILVRPKHPALRLPGIHPQSLKRYPWILPPVNDPIQRLIEDEFAEADVRMPANVVESSSPFTALQLVQQSDAIGVLPESVARDHLQAGLIARLPLELTKQLPKLGILTRCDEPLTAPALEFIDLLRRHTTANASQPMTAPVSASPAGQTMQRPRREPRHRATESIVLVSS